MVCGDITPIRGRTAIRPGAAAVSSEVLLRLLVLRPVNRTMDYHKTRVAINSSVETQQSVYAALLLLASARVDSPEELRGLTVQSDLYACMLE